MRSLKPNKDITILQAGKGTCLVVLNGYKYRNKLHLPLECPMCELLLRKHNFCSGEKSSEIPFKVKGAWLKHELTHYHSEPPHLHGLLRIKEKPVVRSVVLPVTT
jgi:hypothetical protein